MQKKIFSLLVLLMTAVSGAWADTTVTWEGTKLQSIAVCKGYHTNVTTESMTVDGITITANEGFLLNDQEEGVKFLSGADNGVVFSAENNIKSITITSTGFSQFTPDGDFQFEGGSHTYEVSPAATSYGFATDVSIDGITKIEITLEGAPAPAVTVTPTANANEWTFTMPDYAVVAKVEYETELELQEENVNTTVLADWDGYEADVTLQRTLQTRGWNTLALPFNVSSAALTALNGLLAAQGGSLTVKKFANTTLSGETISLNFENATEIEAGKPYLVKVTKDVNLASLSAAIDAAIALGQFSANPFKDAVISKDPVPVETQYADFIPTLGKTLVTGPTGDEDNKDAVLFVAAYNTLKNPTVVNDPEQESSYLKGFRAYFQLKGEATQARSFSMDFGNGEITGIKAIDNGQLTIDNDRYYDLQGRKVNAAQKGVYIVNGKKVIK